MGWRDHAYQNFVRETRFSFSPGAYLDELSKKVHNGIDENILKRYDDLIKALNTLPIRSIRLSGTFNGWNKDQLILKNVAEGIWEVYLHLPSGYYEYRYFIEFENRELIGPSQNWIYDVNLTTGQDPQYGLFSKIFVN